MSFGYSSYTPAYQAASSFRCTSNTFGCSDSSPGQQGMGSVLGSAFTEISKANANKANAISAAKQTGNWSGVTNGTYQHGNYKVIKSNACTRFEGADGHCCGYDKNGHFYTYTK
mmetsp:Transcript_20061/g.17778  ORF Transcript_20061/g.17778 Transcript_20061/m.17778 type:complete len:114 (-) Transcript_20061:172-513(-)